MSLHDFGLPNDYCDQPLLDKRAFSEQLALDKAAWCAQGNTIELVPVGKSGVSFEPLTFEQLNKLSVEESKEYYKKARLVKALYEDPTND